MSPDGGRLDVYRQDEAEIEDPQIPATTNTKNGEDVAGLDLRTGTFDSQNESEQSDAGSAESAPVTDPTTTAISVAQSFDSSSVTPDSDENSLHLKDTEDPDSVANYMEQLLDRTRRSKAVSGDLPTSDNPKTSESAEETVPDPHQDQPTIGQKSDSISLESPSQPRHLQDKQVVRSEMNSLREMANLSTRTAIADHASKRLRGTIFVKSALAVISFSVAAVLLTGEVWGTVSYETTGWAAMVLEAIMAIELARSTLLIHRACKCSASGLGFPKRGWEPNTRTKSTGHARIQTTIVTP